MSQVKSEWSLSRWLEETFSSNSAPASEISKEELQTEVEGILSKENNSTAVETAEIQKVKLDGELLRDYINVIKPFYGDHPSEDTYYFFFTRFAMLFRGIGQSRPTPEANRYSLSKELEKAIDIFNQGDQTGGKLYHLLKLIKRHLKQVSPKGSFRDVESKYYDILDTLSNQLSDSYKVVYSEDAVNFKNQTLAQKLVKRINEKKNKIKILKGEKEGLRNELKADRNTINALTKQSTKTVEALTEREKDFLLAKAKWEEEKQALLKENMELRRENESYSKSLESIDQAEKSLETKNKAVEAQFTGIAESVQLALQVKKDLEAENEKLRESNTYLDHKATVLVIENTKYKQAFFLMKRIFKSCLSIFFPTSKEFDPAFEKLKNQSPKLGEVVKKVKNETKENRFKTDHLLAMKPNLDQEIERLKPKSELIKSPGLNEFGFNLFNSNPRDSNSTVISAAPSLAASHSAINQQ